MTTAASTIRSARSRAGLTQMEVATRAGIPQSVVSAYESSKREPSFETLRRLVAATGFDLDVVLAPAAPKSARQKAVELNRTRLIRALARLGASNIRLFGSVARGDDRPDSDIDILVDVAADVGLFALGRMRSEAEHILGSAVDIVPANSLKPDLAERVLAESIPLLRRPGRDRLDDIRAACEAISAYVGREEVDDDIVFDAIRVRLIEIGEAVKEIDTEWLTAEPTIPWVEIARMRDQLAHRYFDTAHSIVRATAVNDIPHLAAAVARLMDRHSKD